MDEESLIEIIHRWHHCQDEDGWLNNLYLHDDGEGGWYWGKDLKKWEEYSRTASSPSLGMLIGW